LSGVSTTDDPDEPLSHHTAEDYDQDIGIVYGSDDADYSGVHCTVFVFCNQKATDTDLNIDRNPSIRPFIHAMPSLKSLNLSIAVL